jgi:hypothetical protein
MLGWSRQCSEGFGEPYICLAEEENICIIVLANNGFHADKATKNVKGTISRSLCAREAILNKAFLKLLSYEFEVPVSLRNRELLGRSSRVQSQPSKTAINVERGVQLSGLHDSPLCFDCCTFQCHFRRAPDRLIILIRATLTQNAQKRHECRKSEHGGRRHAIRCSTTLPVPAVLSSFL